MKLILKALPKPNDDMVTIADASGLVAAAAHVDLFFQTGELNVVYDNLRLGREVTVSLQVEGVR